MKLLSQCSRAETEYVRVYVLFKESCCLKWDKHLKINEAYKSALEKLSHLQKLYPYYQKIYQQYKLKITGLYNSSVIFLWNERNKKL